MLKGNIRLKEGLRLEAYKPDPSEKYFTIGYGRYGPDIIEGMKITEVQAEKFLDEDIKNRVNEINNVIPKYKNFPIDVKVPIFSEYYRGSIPQSKNTLKLINNGKYKEAAIEFLNNNEYKNAVKLGIPGIRTRMEEVSEALINLSEK
jgi:GH24 family phage-related lysozyme (muramidase)